MDVALGSAATGVFTNSSWLWNHLYEVGHQHYYQMVILFIAAVAKKLVTFFKESLTLYRSNMLLHFKIS